MAHILLKKDIILSILLVVVMYVISWVLPGPWQWGYVKADRQDGHG